MCGLACWWSFVYWSVSGSDTRAQAYLHVEHHVSVDVDLVLAANCRIDVWMGGWVLYGMCQDCICEWVVALKAEALEAHVMPGCNVVCVCMS
jgi:hypothetical protein